MKKLIAIACLTVVVLLSEFVPGWSIYLILGICLFKLMDYLAPSEEKE